jgi:hypothetical protein
LSIEKTLVELGGRCVAGDLILNHQVLGSYRNGEFQASLAGIAMVEDAQKVKQAAIIAVAKEMTSDLEIDVSDIRDYTIGGEAEAVVRRGRRRKSEE